MVTDLLAFLSVPEMGSFHIIKEYDLQSFHCSIVFVSEEELKEKKYRIMGITPCQASNKGEEELKKFNNHEGKRRFNFGMYYSLRHLFFMEDVIEYNCKRLKFEEIRTAEYFAK